MTEPKLLDAADAAQIDDLVWTIAGEDHMATSLTNAVDHVHNLGMTGTIEFLGWHEVDWADTDLHEAIRATVEKWLVESAGVKDIEKFNVACSSIDAAYNITRGFPAFHGEPHYIVRTTVNDYFGE